MIPSPPPPRAYTMGGQDFFQCQGKTYPRHVSAKGSDIPPPPCFLARSPRCVLAILFHPPFLSSARSTCDLATGQVLSVGEFIRRMPVTPLSRIHFQINRPSSCGPSNVNHPVCAKLHPPPQNIPISIIAKWMRHFRIFKFWKSLLFFFFFRWRNKKKINNEKNRYLDKEKFLLGILKGEGWLFYTCCNFNFEGGWRFDPK